MARPSEIKAVVEALMDPADDVQEVAKAVISAVDQSRRERVDYLACIQHGKYAHAYGPYPTYNAAAKAIETGKLPVVDGARMWVMRSYHPTQADRIMEELDAGGMSDEAKQMWEIARNGGQPARTHSRRNRRVA